MTRFGSVCFALGCSALAACAGQLSDSGDGAGDSADGSDDGTDEGDTGDDSGGDGPGGPDGGPPPDYTVNIPTGDVRPVNILPLGELAKVADRAPQVDDPWLVAILESPDTMWYDPVSLVPGYQDSYGDNINFPTGMRPNTIDPGLIAVPGGHGFIFEKIGQFHFPFGKPTGAGADLLVFDFWHVPRDGAGELRPVVWWKHEPTSWHHRVEWMFPVGTTFGELMFKVGPDGKWYPFEIRTRTREIDRWTVDVHRPFRTAAELADALEAKRAENPAWVDDASITALVDHLRDGGNLTPGTLAATHFEGVFPTVNGAQDFLPAVDDDTILQELLLETPFRSARDKVWKEGGGKRAYAATTQAAFQIVPKSFNAGFVPVTQDGCTTCHADAGHTIKDFYPSIMLYGEVWGADEVFTWHPFDIPSFVDASGEVVGFGPPDNRKLRSDFTQAGLLEAYSPGSKHPATTYKRIPRDWHDYRYD